MQFSEMKSEVFRRLNESSSSPAYWSEGDVEDSLNEGMEEMADASEYYERNATVNLYSNKTYYDLRTVLSDTFLAPRRIFNTQTNKWLDPTPVRQLDQYYRRWETATGAPESMFMRGLWWLGVQPKAGGDTGTMKVYYAAIPSPMSADADEPGFPQEFHFGPVEFALYDLLAQEGETQKALGFWKRYIVYETLFVDYVQGRVSLDRVSTLKSSSGEFGTSWQRH